MNLVLRLAAILQALPTVRARRRTFGWRRLAAEHVRVSTVHCPLPTVRRGLGFDGQWAGLIAVSCADVGLDFGELQGVLVEPMGYFMVGV